MTKSYKFSCGCSFPINEDIAKVVDDGLPSLSIDFYNLPLNCKNTWEIYAKGLTQGTFQTESSLLRGWSKKIQPINITELSHLISIVRPGTLKAYENGKCMTQHFLDRKNGEPYEVLDESIKDILSSTQGIILYQEQALKIAKLLAGFSLVQADSLRKGIGKKIASVILGLRAEFIEGCENVKLVTKEKAEEIFDIIEKSSRYSFNLSHGISYAVTSYQTAFVKAHFPLQFYTSWLAEAREKSNFQEEIASLVNDAKSFNITILPPSISKKNRDFEIESLKIRFGLSNIRGIGESSIQGLIGKINDLETQLNKTIDNISWFELLIHFFPKLNKTVVSNLIACGAISHIQIYRQRMLYDYNKTLLLTSKEIDKIIESKIDNLEDALRYLIGVTNKSRSPKIASILESLINLPVSVKDTEEWIATVEEQILGVPITCSKLDVCDTSAANITCLEFNKRDYAEHVALTITISKVSEYIPKAGKMAGMKMLYIKGSDKTGQVEAVAFPTTVTENEPLLFKGNTVLLLGKKSDKNSLTINKVVQI